MHQPTLISSHTRSLNRATGFTLIELLISLAVLGIVMFAVLPRGAPDEPMRLLAAGSVLAADLEYAQSATLANPQQPIVVKFDSKGFGYWLAPAEEPDSPINRPNSSEPYTVTFGMGNAEVLEGVWIDPSVLPEDYTIEYDAFGRLTIFTDVRVKLLNSAGSIEVVVRANTGSVRMGQIAEAGGDDAGGSEEK